MSFLTILTSVLSLGFPQDVSANVQYLCGTIDRRQEAIFHSKSPNRDAAAKGALRACQMSTDSPTDCSRPHCETYQTREDRGQSRRSRRQGLSSGELNARRAIEEFKRRQREEQIDELIREQEDRRRNGG